MFTLTGMIVFTILSTSSTLRFIPACLMIRSSSLIYFIGNETDAYVYLYPPLSEVEHGAHVQRPFRNAESPLHHPKPVILGHYAVCIEPSVGDVSLQSVPFLVFVNLVFTDRHLYVLANFKELVVSALVHLRFGQPASVV